MTLAYEEPTSWSQKPRHHLGPSTYVGEPAQCTDAGVDEIELSRSERADRTIEFALDVVDRSAALASQPGRCLQGRR
jgi:hypothetical protein